MALWKYIQKWRSYPDQTKQMIALWGALIVTVLIVLLWIINSWIVSTYAGPDGFVGREGDGFMTEAVTRIKAGWQSLWIFGDRG